MNNNQLINILKNKCGNNPILLNTINLAQSGDSKGLEQLARNLCNSKGIDVDKAIADIKKQYGI